MKYAIALVAALGMTGCCSTPNPSATPKADPCVKAEAPAKAAAPFGCNSNARAASSPVPMSSVTMPTPIAKAAAVPPAVVMCAVGFVKCLIETLVSPFQP